MNVLFRKSLSFATLAALTAAASLASSGIALAQKFEVIADKPSFDDLLSPEYSGGKQKSFKPKEWLEIEAKLKLTISPEPKTKTLDKLTIKWFIAVDNPEKSGTMHLLTKEVDHVNIPLSEDIFCSVYLSPASIKRMLGTDSNGKRAVGAVGYEVWVDGAKVAAETSKYKVGWWNAPSDKISRSESVPLLNKSETPFSSMWWDRYAEVSEKTAR